MLSKKESRAKVAIKSANTTKSWEKSGKVRKSQEKSEFSQKSVAVIDD
jgi:hypothetical protein